MKNAFVIIDEKYRNIGIYQFVATFILFLYNTYM